MKDRSTFGGTHRPVRSNTGRSLRELQDRAGFDRGPTAGVSCLLALAIVGALWALIISGLIAAVGAIA